MCDGALETDLFCKPSDSKAYLHYDSDHPHHTKKAIPYGLGMRLRRICTQDKDYRRHRAVLHDRLTERGYPDNLVEKELKKADSMKAGQSRRRQNKTDRVPLVLTYSSFLPDVRKILQQKRKILHGSDNLKKLFPQNSLLAYRRGRNLRDDLVHRKTRRVLHGSDRGREDCGKKCVICMRMYEGDGKIQGGQKVCFHDQTIGCKSSNVIYGIWCEICQKVVYVAETHVYYFGRRLADVCTNASKTTFLRSVPPTPVLISPCAGISFSLAMNYTIYR